MDDLDGLPTGPEGGSEDEKKNDVVVKVGLVGDGQVKVSFTPIFVGNDLT